MALFMKGSNYEMSKLLSRRNQAILQSEIVMEIRSIRGNLLEERLDVAPQIAWINADVKLALVFLNHLLLIFRFI